LGKVTKMKTKKVKVEKVELSCRHCGISISFKENLECTGFCYICARHEREARQIQRDREGEAV
jgi:hypothetical protein